MAETRPFGETDEEISIARRYVLVNVRLLDEILFVRERVNAENILDFREIRVEVKQPNGPARQSDMFAGEQVRFQEREQRATPPGRGSPKAAEATFRRSAVVLIYREDLV